MVSICKAVKLIWWDKARSLNTPTTKNHSTIANLLLLNHKLASRPCLTKLQVIITVTHFKPKPCLEIIITVTHFKWKLCLEIIRAVTHFKPRPYLEIIIAINHFKPRSCLKIIISL